MNSNRVSDTSSDIRKTKYTMLKEQQCSLNMQMRLAMQLHDIQAQKDLEKKLKENHRQMSGRPPYAILCLSEPARR